MSENLRAFKKYIADRMANKPQPPGGVATQKAPKINGDKTSGYTLDKDSFGRNASKVKGDPDRAYALNLISVRIGKQHLFEKLQTQRGVQLFVCQAFLGRMTLQHHQSELSQQG